MIDTSGQYDTSELNHKILKAYIANDTAFFKQLRANIKKQTTNRANSDLWNADIPLPNIKNIDADEVYRFIYSLQGGPAYEVITISKKADSCKLHYFSFYGGGDTHVYQMKDQYTESLTIAVWNGLTDKLKQGDFWQLKKGDGVRGLDARDLTVIGYIKPNPARGTGGQYNFVHRFMSSTLDDAFFMVHFRLIDQKRKWF
jgi:hypothetical protein